MISYGKTLDEMAVNDYEHLVCEEEEKIWNLLKQSQNKNFNTWSHYDLTNENENVKFKDSIHLLQDSRNYIGKKISNIIFSEYQNYCN